MEHDDDAKRYLVRHLERPLGYNRYAGVKALTIYWEESDKMEKYREEAEKLQALFQSLQYDTESYQIPTHDSQMKLLECIARYCNLLSDKWRKRKLEESYLLIIHYGGHGDKDDDKHAVDGPQQRRAVWRA
jgi:hypothetical protein